MNDFFILNGTLCNASLWDEFVSAMVIKSKFKKNDFVYPDLATGETILEIAHTIGKSLSEKTWVLGYSLGGIIALELAKHYQHKIKGLLLVSANAEGPTEQKKQAIERQLSYLKQHNLEAVFNDILLPAYFGNDPTIPKHKIEHIKTMGLAMGESTFIKQLSTLQSRIDQIPHLANITLPTLIIYGENDILCTPEQNKRMGQAFSHSTLYECKNVGHMIPLLRASELAQQVIAFMTHCDNL